MGIHVCKGHMHIVGFSHLKTVVEVLYGACTDLSLASLYGACTDLSLASLYGACTDLSLVSSHQWQNNRG